MPQLGCCGKGENEMKVCSYCRNENLSEANFCDFCGFRFSNFKPAVREIPVENIQASSGAEAWIFKETEKPICKLCRQRNWFGAVYCQWCMETQPDPSNFIESTLNDEPVKVSVRTLAQLVWDGQPIALPNQDTILIGRADPRSLGQVDLDLSKFGGTAEAGVSRIHAKLIWDGQWMLQDLNSKNGTFVGEIQIQPFERTPLRGRAIIRFGIARFEFHQVEKESYQT